ncbi:hypothetical protein [Alicyclobacillus shizuokensis]|uniref:hypothetical protein n=1 Tax=Alicyclobacillus shizuokensis TaxID=392014 RepID=UPI000A8BCA71|nr:hypothetical protein [Alicyclobacillus shizuokensis]
MFRAYTLSTNDLKEKLSIYEKARKAYSWNPKYDIPWNSPWGLPEEQLEFAWKLASQSVSAEEVGLLISSRLLIEADDAPSRMCLATAVSDEAKHCEVFARFALLSGGDIQPPDPARENLLDTLLRLPPISRFLIHTLLEGLASDEFSMFRIAFRGTILYAIYEKVIQDESRHVAMGMEYLKHMVSRMNKEEIYQLKNDSSAIFELTHIDRDGAFDWLGELNGRPSSQIQRIFLTRNQSRLNLIFRERR